MTSAPPVPPPLRPLGLGEILDRTVTLCVRGFALFGLIVLIVEIPRGIASYYSLAIFGQQIHTLLKIGTGGSSSDDVLRTLSATQSPWLPLGIVLPLILLPLAVAALVVGSTTLYFGGRISFRECYRIALGRWFPLILLNLVWVVAAIIAYIGIAIPFAIIAVGVVALGTIFKVAGIVFGVIAGVAALLVVIGVVTLLVLGYQISIVACVVERSSFLDAFVSALRRVFSGIGIRRSLLVGLVYGLVIGGLTIATSAGGVLLSALSPVAGTLYVTLLGIVTQIFTTVVMVVFYFDLRVREDGLDLELAAGAAPALAPQS